MWKHLRNFLLPAAVGAGITFIVQNVWKEREHSLFNRKKIVVFSNGKHRSLTLARRLHDRLSYLSGYDVVFHSLSSFSSEEFLPYKMTPSMHGSNSPLFIFVLATYEDVAPSLVNLQLEFPFQYSVFGCGDKKYGDENFNKTARSVDSYFEELQHKRMFSCRFVDMSSRDANREFGVWMGGLVRVLDGSDTSDVDGNIMDVEDVGEMLGDNLRKIMTKEAYHTVGTHSAIKLCRWVKSTIQGRGSCYKYTCYGIQSHRCLQCTPALSCANQCVFCWRHHTNPVSGEWNWKVDDPKEILDEMIVKQRAALKGLASAKGASNDVLEEAMEVKHCAMSLVGEPVMYPRINEFINLLHDHRISSFLVMNGQFPKEMKALVPVTQMYISLDAPNAEKLREIDRPMFPDYWERLLSCLDILSERSERTVCRLTVIKRYNMEDVGGYAKLVLRGKPDFVELKGMTFSGEPGPDSDVRMTMENVPYHEEVLDFAKGLVSCLDEYEIACEHQHSCCVLLAHKSFRKDGTWCTWIDFDVFSEKYRRGEAMNAVDYSTATPAEWAVFSSESRGFDPAQQRYRRKRKGKDKEKEKEKEKVL